MISLNSFKICRIRPLCTQATNVKLSEFIQAELEKPWEPGETDCASTTNRWVIEATGIDPMHERKHKSQADMDKWLEASGGLLKAVTKVMNASPFCRTRNPQTGDIGLIIHNNKLCVAINAGDFWVSRDESGLIGAQTKPVRAWRIDA